MSDHETTVRARIDWDALRQEYVFGPPISIRGLARKHGMTYRIVQRRSNAKAENWAQRRAVHIAVAESRISKQIATVLAEAFAAAVIKHLPYLLAKLAEAEADEH